MRQRPIGDLLDAMNQLGGNCRGESQENFPPVLVRANGLRGGSATIRGDISSQFLSGLLMAAPLAASDVWLVVEGELVSKPYVAMTSRIVHAFGPRIETQANYSRFHVAAPQRFSARTYTIEPDASAASYFWAAAAITGGEVTVDGLTRDSLQGDVRFVECLEAMGCRVKFGKDGITVSGRAERGIDVDMNDISDTVQTLAAVALFAEGNTTIRGVAHIRHKETDRIGDLARELRKFGAQVDEYPDGLRIEGVREHETGDGGQGTETATRSVSEGPARPILIKTYNDHRMAMSLALPGLVIPGVSILNPGCTAKTYPAFFNDLSRLVG
jgi:3-phosphoshikimate 1-carboxyvinyltransferase